MGPDGVSVGKGVYLAAERLRAAARECWQRLRRGEDGALLYLLGAALVGDVEMTHGVNVVAPEFYAHRLALSGGEKVKYPAAAGELPLPLHLIAAAVAAADERILHDLYGAAAAVGYGERSAFERIARYGALDEAGDGRGHDLRLADGELVERGEAALLRLAGGGLCGVERIVAHDERAALLAKHTAHVAREALGGGVVRADDEDGTPGLKAQRGGKVRPVHRRQAGNERGKPAALQ